MNEPVTNESPAPPSRTAGGVFAALFLLTAAMLVWIGSVLGPEAADATEGFTRILFTVVPIRLFAYAMALVFVALGLRVGWNSWRAEAPEDQRTS